MMKPWSDDPRPLRITCGKGIAPFLRSEVEALGFPVSGESAGGVETAGTLAGAMRLNIHLRTALRVLWEIAVFDVLEPRRLHALATELPWEDWIAPDGYVCVNSFTQTPAIRDTRFAGLTLKDAIVDRLQKVYGRRPDSGSDTSRTVVFLYWREREARIYLDTSGDSLSRRGYRKEPMKAPMQETLAAAVVLATEWDRKGAFVNPMCGSGTLAIEAALLASNHAPGLLRDNFGFMHILGFPRDAWDALRREAVEAAVPWQGEPRIVATDLDPAAVEAARRNAALAGVAGGISFGVCDFADTPMPASGGVVVLNPPYGERMGADDGLDELYRRIGDFFKQRGQGYTGFVFTGSPDLGKRVGLRASRKVPFFNSEIECRLLGFKLYEGTIRAKYNTPVPPVSPPGTPES
jgi:putative N6-adenine-specific DNA methylase